MTRAEIADDAAKQIIDLSCRYPVLSHEVVKMIVLSALLEAANIELERTLEDTRKQLDAIRGGDDAITS